MSGRQPSRGPRRGTGDPRGRDFGEAPRRRVQGRPPQPARGGSRSGAWALVAGLAALVIGVVAFTGGDDPKDPTPTTSTQTPAGFFKILIPEGFRREDVAARIEETTDLSGEEYLASTAPGASGRRLAGTRKPTSLEGFLFPATYEMSPVETAADLVDKQVLAYQQNVEGIDYSKARAGNLSRYEVLIIASMIEREVRREDERALVASVIYNRLRKGMRLDIDATVQYAVGEWRALTGADLKIDSPYNTRDVLGRVPGLPPGPICSPGKASIVAAAAPAESDFLYYVAKNDGSGGHYFVTTPEEFEAAVARARANGGG